MAQQNDTVIALSQILSDDHWQVRARAAQLLGQMRDPAATPALREALGDTEWPVRLQALVSISLLDAADSRDAVQSRLRDEEATIRQLAAQLLGQGGSADADSVETLVKSLEDPEWRVRAAVAQALGQIKAVSALEHLITLTQREQVAEVRSRCVWALSQLKDEQSREVIIERLKADEARTVRLAAVFALMQFADDPVALAALVETLQVNGDIPMRVAAIYALGWLRHPDAAPDLLPWLESPDWLTRARTAAALGRIGYGQTEAFRQRLASDLGPLLSEDIAWVVRCQAALALGLLQQGIDTLRQALVDPEWSVRCHALLALTWQVHHQTAAITAAFEDDTWPVRTATLLALGQSGDDEDRAEMFTQGQLDPVSGVRWAAAYSLASIQGLLTAPATSMLHDTDANVRWSAYWALAVQRELTQQHLGQALLDPTPSVRQLGSWLLPLAGLFDVENEQ